jgi:hypothetical protein
LTGEAGGRAGIPARLLLAVSLDGEAVPLAAEGDAARQELDDGGILADQSFAPALPGRPGLYLWEGELRADEERPDDLATWAGACRCATAADLAAFGIPLGDAGNDRSRAC